ncbi:uncharacterized protein [Haliotis cracherodii]|uniref:uncharacterized protein n=1 Tax=Haliotis cracherodii TaxID=6455 RepID=UPI0039ECE127
MSAGIVVFACLLASGTADDDLCSTCDAPVSSLEHCFNRTCDHGEECSLVVLPDSRSIGKYVYKSGCATKHMCDADENDKNVICSSCRDSTHDNVKHCHEKLHEFHQQHSPDNCLTCHYNGHIWCDRHERCDDDKACYIQETRDSYNSHNYNGYHAGCIDKKACDTISSRGVYHNHRVVKGACCYSTNCNSMHFLEGIGIASTTNAHTVMAATTTKPPTTTEPATTTKQQTTAEQTTTVATETTTVIKTTVKATQPPSTSVPTTATTPPSTTEGYRLCATYTDQTSPHPSNKQRCATAEEMCFLQQYTAPDHHYKLFRSGCSNKQNCDVISDKSRDPTVLYGACSITIEQSLNEFLRYQHEREMDNLRHEAHCRKCTAAPLQTSHDCGQYQACFPEQACAVQVTNDGGNMNMFSECVPQSECNFLQTNYMHQASSHQSILCGSCCGNMTCAVDECKRQLLSVVALG